MKIALSTGVSLSLVDLGDRRARDVLVLLPGLGDSWRSYEAVLPHLPTSIRTVAISQRGQGDSDKPEADYAVCDFEADLLVVLDALGIQRAVVAGHSSASIIARRFALDHPERVAGLVLEGSFVHLVGVPDGVAAKVASLSDPISREFVHDFNMGTFALAPPPGFVEAMDGESLKTPARVWRATLEWLVAYDDARELSALAAPTLIVWGDQDALVDRSATDALARSIPRSTLLAYDHVGHTPHWEAPERFARDVAAFVEQCHASLS